MWQYSESGRVPGISGNVDMHYCYKKYPKKKSTAKKSQNTFADLNTSIEIL